LIGKSNTNEFNGNAGATPKPELAAVGAVLITICASVISNQFVMTILVKNKSNCPAVAASSPALSTRVKATAKLVKDSSSTTLDLQLPETKNSPAAFKKAAHYVKDLQLPSKPQR
jgi:hypothetical protein